jgi:hypothetical protein
VRVVNRSEAVRLLPDHYAVAIRLHDEGASDHVIAVAVAIDDDQVAALLDIAGAKLVNLIAPVPPRGDLASPDAEHFPEKSAR